MASSKEIQQSSRPLAHRPSLSTASSGPSSRQSHSRTSSHSLLAGPGPINSNNRVTRRKSMTNNAANVAAVAAALRDEGTPPMPIASSGHRRHMASRSLAGRSALAASLPSPPASLPASRFISDFKADIPENAIDDDAIEMSAEEGDVTLDFQKARIRRASDGQPLTKEGKKGSRVELRCDQCGKGYKHSSCLTKHLWEHTPEWSYTSKLLISKHQQVQLLEAASVLVAMNTENPKDSTATPPDSAKDFPSDGESASPAASGYSEQHERDRQSSADTTPPPQLEKTQIGQTIQYRQSSKRYSSGSAFSRSYQSTTPSLYAGSAPNANGFGYGAQSNEKRPPSSGRNATGQEDRDLAAALLGCSFGSNSGSSTVLLPADAPPVPPVPAQYLGQAASFSSTSFINNFPSRQPESFTRGTMRGQDTKMEDSAESGLEDDDDDMTWRARSDDEVGVFGDMVL